jgi:hypothetical protein
LTLILPFNTRAEARYLVGTTAQTLNAPSPEPQLAASNEPKAQALSASARRPAPPTAALASLTPSAAPAGFVSFTFPTATGVRYVIEGKATLDQPQWTRIEAVTGTGEVMQFIDTAHEPMAFFRVTVENHNNQP